MIEIINSFIDMSTNFINQIFLFQIEMRPSEWIPIGKIITAFVFFAFAIYFILDAMGILDRGGEE